MHIGAQFFGVVCLFLLVAGCGDGDGNGGNNGNNDQPAGWEQAFDSAEAGWLMSVAGAAPDAVYAVGGTPDRGQIWHFDGSDWAAQQVPEDVELLNWVHVFDDATPIIAANGGVILRRGDDGWQAEQTPTDQNLWGVWGASKDDIWAVGGDGRTDGAATVVRFRDGRWTTVELPELERPNVRAFFKVWGTDSDNVYIVGQRGAVLHFDGDDLRELHVGTSLDLISLWGTGPDNIVIVGGRSNGIVVHYDGTQWSVHQQAPLTGLNGVWMSQPDRAAVAGNAGLVGLLDLEDFEITTQDVDTRLDMHATFGVDGGPIYAVGGSLSRPQEPFEGVALRRGGQ